MCRSRQLTMKDKFELQQWTVVTFDICSSSNVIEDLTLTENLDQLCFVLNRLKDFIRSQAAKYEMLPYKFVGDGWILLFPANISGGDILDFLTRLSCLFDQLSRTRIIRYLEHTPKPWGLTFGIDTGTLARTSMLGRAEFVGRPLNIACRLQSAIKDRDRKPAYKVLSSRTFYERHRETLTAHDSKNVIRVLRNIRGGDTFRCVKFDLYIPE